MLACQRRFGAKTVTMHWGSQESFMEQAIVSKNLAE
jgi:hypothetical protein